MSFSMKESTFNNKAIEATIRAAIELYGKSAAKKLEAEAKQTAPWIDRTSNARNSIQGGFQWKGNHGIITLSGNMYYSVFLELANEKKYAVLFPVIEKNAPEILRAYRSMF